MGGFSYWTFQNTWQYRFSKISPIVFSSQTWNNKYQVILQVEKQQSKLFGGWVKRWLFSSGGQTTNGEEINISNLGLFPDPTVDADQPNTSYLLLRIEGPVLASSTPTSQQVSQMKLLKSLPIVQKKSIFDVVCGWLFFN